MPRVPYSVLLALVLLPLASGCGPSGEQQADVTDEGEAKLRVQDAQDTPRCQETAIPNPPLQEAAWKAPRTRLPAALVSASNEMFNSGVADPRGCEYREVDIVVGSVWGQTAVVKTTGWVLPSTESVGQHFAVSWGGLVYPVVSVGPAVDLTAQVNELLGAKEGHRRSLNRAWTESQSISAETFLPIGALLLFRAGEVTSAERYWKTWSGTVEQNVNNNARHLRDPFLLLAANWAWALLDRAICAHMRGDDKLALASAEQLWVAGPKLKSAASKRGFKRGMSGGIGSAPFGLLSPLSTLLQDQRRRANQRHYRTAMEVGLQNFATKSDFVQALIRDLEIVSVRQMGQPGGVHLGGDPNVKALVDQGAEAVEPLLKCLETDERLTRSVRFGRDFFRHRHLVGVHEAAFAALVGILKTGEFGIKHPTALLESNAEDRHKLAGAIREYWEQYRDAPIVERWYLVLLDDTASPDQWLNAAQQITRPESFQKPKGPMAGESLRDDRVPTVSQLLAQRAEQLAVKGRPRSSTDMFTMHTACNIALQLANWDKEFAITQLKKQTQYCLELFDRNSNGLFTGSTNQRLADYIGQFVTLRATAGDETGLDEFAKWIQGVSPGQLEDYTDGAFRPFYEHPEHSAIAQAAERMFNAEASPWNPLLNLESPNSRNVEAVFKHEGMARLSAFRTQMKRALKDTREVGTVSIVDEDSIRIEIPNVGTRGQGRRKWKGLLPDTGTTLSLRVCDIHAHLLSQHKEFPRCELFWSKAKRDAAINACLQQLESTNN